MKILHINSYYSTGKFYKNLYNKQVEGGLDIDVFVPVPTNYIKKDFDYGEFTKLSKNHGKYDRYIFHLKHQKILKDIIQKFDVEKYSLTHAHSLFSNGYISYKLFKIYNIPYVVAVRDTDVNLFFKKIIYLRSLGTDILKNASRIIFVSEPYKNHVTMNYIHKTYKDEAEAKSVVIPNGIDKFWHDNKAKKTNRVIDRNINLLYVGILTARKNIETTIKACEILMKQGYKVKYKIVGKIKNNKYKVLIEKHPFIEYIEHCSKEELIWHYRNADIFVMPSKTETFGLVYAEALSQGTPVIYTSGQGFDGQFDEGEVGYSVNHNSAEDISNKILDIIKNYTYISRNCINKVDKFSWEKISKSYSDIYKTIENK